MIWIIPVQNEDSGSNNNVVRFGKSVELRSTDMQIHKSLNNPEAHNFFASRNETGVILKRFQQGITNDPRICPAHISLFLAILQFHEQQGKPISASKKQIVVAAKISETTYHRCIHQLHEYGYIRYMPSFDPKQASSIYISRSNYSIDDEAR